MWDLLNAVGTNNNELTFARQSIGSLSHLDSNLNNGHGIVHLILTASLDNRITSQGSSDKVHGGIVIGAGSSPSRKAYALLAEKS